MTLSRYSSRKDNLVKGLLAPKLKDAVLYKRIAGYFRSSIFELIGEEIANIPDVRIICNSDLDENDIKIAKSLEASLTERWNEETTISDVVLHREAYLKFSELLKAKNLQIRVIQREKLFLHGKAGMIQYLDGSRKSFVGSVNETKRAFAKNYEIVWLDDDPDSANWVEEEFDALWEEGVPLPQAVIEHIERVAKSEEISLEKLEKLPNKDEQAGAVFNEAPIYRNGDKLSPWQKSFVSHFLEHRKIYNKSRLLLADEVGLGKTLSMACSGMISAILGDGPVLILAPSTLIYQWQAEMLDKLGIPSAVWVTNKKGWIDNNGHYISSKGDYRQIKHCPCSIGIVSTGLIMHHYDNKKNFLNEAGEILRVNYGMVILDEAHKARGAQYKTRISREQNNLLKFMMEISKKCKHLILGTATPIQTNIEELWDLMKVLSNSATFVLGDTNSLWRNVENAKEVIKGNKVMESPQEAWQWLKNPLPPESENATIKEIREDNDIDFNKFEFYREFEELAPSTRKFSFDECIDSDYFKKYNPFVRHIVLRKRKDLENKGLLDKIAVRVHPLDGREAQYKSHFVGNGLLTNAPFLAAYEKVVEFCRLIQRRSKVTGFMKTIILQRICSSFFSGLKTAEKLLNKSIQNIDYDTDSEEIIIEENNPLESLTSEEAECLNEIKNQLSRPEAIDPKLATVKWFLTKFKTDNKTWLEHGCIIFSQYYDTVLWIAENLSKELPEEKIAVYAGFGKSGIYINSKFTSIDRESIKAAVKNKELRLVIATDAACEGLNLQTLGTLINIDLPWNPSKLEQRLGRIKRFGQKRKSIDMLNLVYSETQDEAVYNALSKRMKDTYDIFGSLPDSIEDDWIDDVEKLEEHIDTYISEREKAKNAFDIKYNDDTDPNNNKWEKCNKILSRKDIIDLLSKPW